MRQTHAFVMLLALCCAPAFADGPPPADPPGNPGQVLARPAPPIDRIVDRVIWRENELFRTLLRYEPLVETYIQRLEPNEELGAVPKEDHYFLGKLDLSRGVNSRSLIPAPGLGKKVASFFSEIYSFTFLPNGFAQMILLDGTAFDRQHYDIDFVRREFLGEVRTLVFEVTPKKKSGVGRFLGRIWVEDQDYNVVRFNGIYAPASVLNKYLHFDSWRVQMGPGLWLPAYVYSEESAYRYFISRKLNFRAQTRLWGYNLAASAGQEEFTKVMVEAPSARDQSEGAGDASPIANLRAWEREAEENVVHRLQKGGLLAPEGEVDKVLNTVVNNLEVTNNVDVQPEVRCRVLLTTPLESFSVGHTIILSRGLIDVLPDEGSLAMVLAHELGHIILGHRLDTKYAFSDRMLFDDEETFARFGLRRPPAEEAAADQKAAQLLDNSPYKDKLANAGLFLKALAQRAKPLRSLIAPHLGDSLAGLRTPVRMGNLMAAAPELEMSRTDQVPALPLGGRIKVDPWSGAVELLKAKPVAILSAREKLLFELTPFMPYLSRQASPGDGLAAGPPAGGVAGSVPPKVETVPAPEPPPPGGGGGDSEAPRELPAARPSDGEAPRQPSGSGQTGGL